MKYKNKHLDWIKIGNFTNKILKFNYLFIVPFLFLLILSTGFFTVNADEEGIIMRFGKYRKEVTAGLNYKLPYPIEIVEKISVKRIKKDIIGKFSNQDSSSVIINKINDNDLSYSKESQMLTGDENIIDMHFYIQWKISDAKDYLFNIKDSKTENIVRSAAESVMRQVVSEVTLSEALSEKRLFIEYEVKNNLQMIMNSYGSGIYIVNVGILYSYVGPEVRDSYRDVQSAKADRERFINQAQAYRNEVIPRARAEAATIVEKAIAYKESIVSKAKGETNKFEKIFYSYIVNKEITKRRMYLDTMEKVYLNSDKYIFDKSLSKTLLYYLSLDKK